MTAGAEGREMYALAERMFPLCRSITGNGVRETLSLMGEHHAIDRHEVASGTSVLDWTVPREWNVRGASITDAAGNRIVDFAEHNLHLVNYSVPFSGRLSRAELLEHVHTLPDQPDVIPYRTSYYRDAWGFCMRHRDLERLNGESFTVAVDTELTAGSLTYGESYLAGTVTDEVLIYSHLCHPSIANDNLSGLVVTLWLAQYLARQPRRLSYRFVWGPGTIGSITWLARNEAAVPRVKHGLVAVLLGGPGPFHYKPSRSESERVDEIVTAIVRAGDGVLLPFDPYGYDERQFCSPGIDLPMGRLTRTPHDAYPEYHTSADDMSLISPERLQEALDLLKTIVEVFEHDRCFVNLAPKGEPQLGRRGLYRATGGRALPGRELAMLWVLNQSDGTHSLFDISRKAGMPFATIRKVAEELQAAGLLAPVEEAA